MKYNSKTLDELCDVRIGRTPPRNQSEWFNSGASDDWKWVSIKDMGNCGKFITATSETITDKAKKTFNYATVTSGTILLSFKLTLGRVVICDGEFVTNEAIAQVPIKDPSIIDRDYLYYYLKNYNWSNIGSTSSIATAVNSKMVKSIKIVFPDLETQKKIVRVLSALDQKIELNNRLIDLLYGLGDAIYGMIQNDNPRTVTLKDISINYDKRRVPLSSRQREERRGKFPYYGATSILDYVDDYLFDGEYVLLGEDGTVMTNEGGAVLQYIWGKNWVNNHAHVLQGSEVSTEYLLFALRSVNVSALVTGAVQPKINQENMNKIKLSIGSEDKMSEAEESIKTIAAQIRNLTNENKSLSDMRDTLLPKLMSGEVKLDGVTL